MPPTGDCDGGDHAGARAIFVTDAPLIPPLLPWHLPQWRIVSEASAAGRLSHALLLAGVAGVGKRMFARRIAAATLCEQADGAVCGACGSCKQFSGGAHPSYIALRRDEDRRDIAIDAVRDLCSRLAMSSHNGHAKVALVDPVDALNQNGANALLKTLEEPPPGSLLLLISECPLALPATLRSRCQLLRFGLPPFSQAHDWLATQCPQNSAEERESALRLSRGAPLRAVELLADGESLEACKQWSMLMRDLSSGQTDPLQVAAAVKPDQTPAFLQWLAGWVLDMLRNEPAGAGAKAWARLGEAVNDAVRQLRGNANALLTLESLLIGWSATLARAQRGD